MSDSIARRSSTGGDSSSSSRPVLMSEADLQDVLTATFIGKELTKEIKELVRLTSGGDALPAANFRKIAILAVKHLESVISTSSNIPSSSQYISPLNASMNAISTGLTPEQISSLVGDASLLFYFDLFFHIFFRAFRLGPFAKESNILNDLTKTGLKQEYATEIVNVFKSRREAMELAFKQSQIGLPTITNVDWRLDVGISSTSLNRIFKPSLTLSLTLSNGEIVTFETSTERFHEFRYAIAKLYKQAQETQNHPTLQRDVE